MEGMFKQMGIDPSSMMSMMGNMAQESLGFHIKFAICPEAACSQQIA